MREIDKTPPPRHLPLDLDATGDRLNEQFARCQSERIIAEDKITNLRQSMLSSTYAMLRRAADECRAKCDRFWYKMQIH